MEEKNYKSWTISDEFWEEVKDAIPDTAGKRDPNKTYERKPGQGRKPLPARDVLEGVLYVLRTGVQWKAVPKAYGSGSSLHRYFQKWTETGFFRKIWAMGLEKYDELKLDSGKFSAAGNHCQQLIAIQTILRISGSRLYGTIPDNLPA